MPRSAVARLAVIAVLFAPAVAAAQVVVGQTDTFQDGTTDGWRQGIQSPNPPTNVATGGPAGAGDMYMRVLSLGGAGADSKLVVINTAQWASSTGTTYSPAVTGLAMDLENQGSTALTMRIAFEDINFNEYSTTGIALPADATWHHVMFSLTNATMTQISGTTQPFSVALADGIQQVRILDAVNPAFNGDPIAATLGVDNVAAVGVPEPGSFALLAVAGVVAGAWRRIRAGRGIRE